MMGESPSGEILDVMIKAAPVARVGSIAGSTK
jgi:hypothetical protein